ncbi:hypothetical protein NM688_g3132 [Phlebia brevispora]|uniref:Uncharacterized protein n=1 Tax=Phlebia brevispora TaxID=194682 RepID=A0ACC1T712_9APHY|nr:hypothetical protein NM688_g3132 [Phlebia brevispora]
MSSKCTLFVELKRKGRRGQYNLDWVPVGKPDSAAPSRDGNLRFTSRHALHIGSSQVFKGTLKIGDDLYPKKVVCKLVVGDVSRTRAEADFYEKYLKTVQGFLVPKFIGMFSGTSKYSEEDVACLLLEYAGKALQDSWTDIPIETRSKVMDELMRLHRMGVYHNDFDPGNFVVDETGHPYMIDFEEAEMHECHVANREFKMYEVEPLRTELDCAEVCEASMEMDIWTRVKVAFHGIVVDVRDIKTVDDLVEIAMRWRPHSSFTAEEWTKRAQQFLSSYDDQYLRRIRERRNYERSKKEAHAAVDTPSKANALENVQQCRSLSSVGECEEPHS